MRCATDTRARLRCNDLDFVANIWHMRAPCRSDATGEAPPNNYIDYVDGMMRNPMRRIGRHIIALSAAARPDYRSSERGLMCATNAWFLSPVRQPGQGFRQPE